jgi:hypothetical protein
MNAETVFNKKEKQKDALAQEAARHEQVIANMHRLRDLRLAAEKEQK